jgi:hypothetical protein
MRRTKKQLQAHKQYLKHRKERIAKQLKYNRAHAKKISIYMERYRIATKLIKTDVKKLMLDKFRTWAGDKPQVQLKLMQQLESAPLRTEHGSGFAQLNRSITGTNRKHSIKLRMNLRTRRLEIWFHNSTEPYMED